MTNCMNFQKKIFVFAVMFIILSNSGCIAELNSQELNHEASSNDIIIISNIDDLKKVMESDTSENFDLNIVYLLDLIEDHDYAYEKEIAAETAYSISLEMENYGLEPLNVDILEDYENYESEMTRVNRVIDVLNENMDYDFKPIQINKASHGNFIQLMNKGQKYLPVVDSYNELLNSSDLVIKYRNNSEYVKRFYICAFLLSVDIVLIESGGIHKGVFKSVGSLNSELRLMKSVQYLGYSGYGLLLSTIYWSIRGYVEGFKNDIYDVLRDGLPEDAKDKYLVNISNEISIDKENKQIRLKNVNVDLSKLI